MKIIQGGDLTGDDRGQQHRTEERAIGIHDGALFILMTAATWIPASDSDSSIG